jgi:hypothetical protein
MIERPSMVARPEQWWAARVTFERSVQGQDVLPDDVQGACGWMACLAQDKDSIMDRIETALTAVGLKLRELDRVTPICSSEDLRGFDDHLAQNIENVEPGKKVVWGTIHLYRAHGEA